MKIAALFFVGYTAASFTGVLLNNILVTIWGYSLLFYTLGSLAVISLILSFFFELEKTIFIPKDEKDTTDFIK